MSTILRRPGEVAAPRLLGDVVEVDRPGRDDKRWAIVVAAVVAGPGHAGRGRRHGQDVAVADVVALLHRAAKREGGPQRQTFADRALGSLSRAPREV